MPGAIKLAGSSHSDGNFRLLGEDLHAIPDPRTSLSQLGNSSARGIALARADVLHPPGPVI